MKTGSVTYVGIAVNSTTGAEHSFEFKLPRKTLQERAILKARQASAERGCELEELWDDTNRVRIW